MLGLFSESVGRVVRAVLVASLAFAGTGLLAAPALASSVSGVSVAASTLAASATGVKYTVDFKATSALTAGSSTITLTGPNGPISVNQPQLVSGSTYSIGFATQITDGVYTLTIAPTVTDYAGNEMDQNQNGVNGEAADVYQTSFSIALPALVVDTVTPSATFHSVFNWVQLS